VREEDGAAVVRDVRARVTAVRVVGKNILEGVDVGWDVDRRVGLS
jgi:hypothetical protein